MAGPHVPGSHQAAPADALFHAIAALLEAQGVTAAPAEIRAAVRTWLRLAPPSGRGA